MLLSRHCGLVRQTLASLQDVVDLEADVINLGEPLHRHVFWEHPGIATSLCEVEDHVLNERSTEDIVVFKRRPLVQELVVLACRATAIEGLPLLGDLRLLLGIVLLALRILDCAAEVIVVEVVLLHKSLPVLIGIKPLGLGQEGDGRILEGDPERPRTILQDVLGLLHGLLAALHGRVKELPTCALILHRCKVVLLQHCVQEAALLRMKVLKALQHLLVADLRLPGGPIDGLRCRG
mmetsp:Transcript_49098/g.107244  ORF Transcript_49098/g.107244 Transcript_49098/m.107244 type:complete len:236 (-) Transcript_49098:217-924(-)